MIGAIWSSVISAGRWPMPSNSISVAPGPRRVISRAVSAGSRSEVGTAQEQGRAADLVPQIPHQDAAQAPGAVSLGDAGVVVAQEAAIAVGAHAVLGQVTPVVVVQGAERCQGGADVPLGVGEIGKPWRRGVEVDAETAQGRAGDDTGRYR